MADTQPTRALTAQERAWLVQGLTTLSSGEHFGGGQWIDEETNAVKPLDDPIDPSPYLAQIDSLRVAGRCECGEINCSTIRFQDYGLGQSYALVISRTDDDRLLTISIGEMTERIVELEIIKVGDSAVSAHDWRAGDPVQCEELEVLPNPAADEFVRRGMERFQTGDWSVAIECFDSALELTPESPAAVFGKGLTLGELRQFDEALVCLERARRLGHPHATAAIATSRAEQWVEQGTTRAREDEWHDAIYCYDRALEANAKCVRAWYFKGVALAESDRHDEALVCFDRAIALHEPWAATWCFKGIVLVRMLRFAGALDCFKRAHALGYANAADLIAMCREELRKMEG